MKKLFIYIFILICLTGCSYNKAAFTDYPEIHNSRNSLDWPGEYSGIISAADGQDIKINLTLNQDNSYVLIYEYLDKPDGNFFYTGYFTWDSNGGLITIDDGKSTSHYKVGEHILFILDQDKKEITGNLKDNYILKKLSINGGF